jgi:hypothetical protein
VPRASRSLVLQRSLATLVLPHTFRLPLPAVAPALPSATFTPASDPEVVEVISQTLMAAIGVLAMPPPEVLAAAAGAGAGAPAPSAPTVPVPTELPWAGLVVMGFVADKCRVVYCNERRRVTRSLLVARVGREADAQRVVVATTASAMSTEGAAAVTSADTVLYSSGSAEEDVDVVHVSVGLEAATPASDRSPVGVVLARDLTFLNSSASVLAVCADDVTVATEHLHATLLNMVARVWREAGLPVGDVVPPYVYAAHRCAVPDSPWTASDNAVAGLGGGAVYAVGGAGNALAGSSGESLSSRLFGMLLSHEQVHGCLVRGAPPPPSPNGAPPKARCVVCIVLRCGCPNVGLRSCLWSALCRVSHCRRFCVCMTTTSGVPAARRTRTVLGKRARCSVAAQPGAAPKVTARRAYSGGS